MHQRGCPFCPPENCRITLENACALAFPDAFPVAEGHMLVVPRQHVASVFDLPGEEQAALWTLVALVRGKPGRQAAVVSKIVDCQQACGASLFRHKQVAPDRWAELIGEVDDVVRVMPLWKLQTVGEERLDFLYENLDRGNRITLKPGVVFCLRAFYELIRDLIEGAWVRFVQKVNADKLGSVTDLGTFLFGEERANLDAYRPILMDVQHGICRR
jgi:hypothetical protein